MVEVDFSGPTAMAEDTEHRIVIDEMVPLALLHQYCQTKNLYEKRSCVALARLVTGS
jgi:hypothetical protein